MSLWRNRTGKSRTNSVAQSQARQRAKALRPACESLERRTLFATVTWITQGDGNWSTGSNWDTGTAPALGDDVVINIPGLAVTVTYNAGGTIRPQNLVNNEVLRINNSTLAWTGGTWEGSGVIFINGASNLAISGSAEKVLKNGQFISNSGQVTQTGSGNLVGDIGARIENNFGAVWDVQSDADITFRSGVGDGYFLNFGTFIKSGAGDTFVSGAQGFTFQNRGTTDVQNGTLALGDEENIAISTAGDFTIAHGAVLDFVRGSHYLIPFRPTSSYLTSPEDYPSITGDGTLRISGTSEVRFFGAIDVHRVLIDGGTLLLHQNYVEDAGEGAIPSDQLPEGLADELIVNSGVIGGSGAGIIQIPGPETREMSALIVSDVFTWTGGDLKGKGRITIAENAVATISGNTARSMDGTFVLDLFSNTDWLNDATITVAGNSRFWIHNSAVFFVRGNGSIVSGIGGGQVWNEGNFLKIGGTGTTTISGTSEDLTNTEFFRNIFLLRPIPPGLPAPHDPLYEATRVSVLGARVDIEDGTLAFGGTSLNGQTILVKPGTTLQYISGTHVSDNAGEPLFLPAKILGVDGGGTLDLGNARFVAGTDALTDVPTVRFGTGTYEFNNPADGGQVVIDATFDGGETGKITGLGALKVRGDFIWNSGDFSGVPGTGSGSLLIDENAALIIPSGDRATTNGYTVENRGIIRWTTSPGALSVNGDYIQTNTGSFLTTLTSTAPAFDQLRVAGDVILDGLLTVALAPGLAPTVGQTFTIIDNLGTAPITGKFRNLAEGDTITIGSVLLAVSYVGGSGNDMVLTASVIPSVTVATPAAVVEGNAGTTDLVFTVSLSEAVAQTVTVDYSTASGTATSGIDFNPVSSTLTFSAGQLSQTVTVQVIGETLEELTETFTLTIANPVDATLGTVVTATGTITDDDSPPVIEFLPTTYTVAENAGPGVITVTRSNPLIAVTVDYTTNSGSAVAGVDFTPVAGTLSFDVGVTTLTIEVPILDDTIYEGDESLTITLANPVGGASSISAGTATLTITDDEPLPVVTVSDPVIDEASLVMPFVISIPTTAALDVTIAYSTSDSSAVAGVNYTPVSGTAVIPAGQTSVTINVPIIDVTTPHPALTLVLNLATPGNAALGETQGFGTINQNQGTFSFAASEYTVREGVRNLSLTVDRTGGSDGAVTVNFTATPGTATATDFSAEALTLTFAAGETSKTFVVTITDDEVFESVESFTIALDQPSAGAALGTIPSATVTITDNDAASGVVASAIRSRSSTFVRIYDASSLNELLTFRAFGNVSGSIRLAVGDLNADGVQDVVVATSKSGTVRAFDGTNGAALGTFVPLGSGAREIFIATGDINADGRDDIIVSAKSGSTVTVIDSATNAQLAGGLGRFNVFSSKTFSKGVSVASGDVNNDGYADVIVGSVGKKSNRVQVYDGFTAALTREFSAYSSSNKSGVFVASGDVDGDGFDDIITAPVKGNRSNVRVFDGESGLQLASFSAFGSRFSRGTSIGITNINGDGKADIVASARVKDGQAQVRRFRSPLANDYLVYSVQHNTTAQPFSAGA